MIGGDQSGSELIGEGGGDQSDRRGSERVVASDAMLSDAL